MNMTAALEHFGGRSALVRVLNVSRQATYVWGDSIPVPWALVLERVTEGQLEVTDAELHQFLNRTGRSSAPGRR